VANSNALRSGRALTFRTVACAERVAVKDYRHAIRYYCHVLRQTGARRERHEKSR
jgi:hypothetical protein